VLSVCVEGALLEFTEVMGALLQQLIVPLGCFQRKIHWLVFGNGCEVFGNGIDRKNTCGFERYS